MKFLPLVWAGLWRKPVRTVLTLLSIVTAFFLFGVLHGITMGLDTVINRSGGVRLRVSNRINPVNPLPLAYRSQLERIPGVDSVVHYTWFGGYYQDRKNSVTSNSVDMSTFLKVFPEWLVPPEQVEAMRRTRTGAIVGEAVMERFGWKIGDRVPLTSSMWQKRDGSSTWEFDIVGVYRSQFPGVPTNQFFLHYDYLDEARAYNNDTVMQFAVRVKDASQAAGIARTIDEMFINSSDSVYTQNESDWLRSQVSNYDNVTFFVRSTIGAVLFTLLILTGVTMMQSIRERVPELAVLKTYGYGDATVTALVFAEGLLLCEAAALAGLMLASAAYPHVFQIVVTGVAPIPVNVFATGFGVAALLALLSAVPPAWRAHRLDIAAALARG